MKKLMIGNPERQGEPETIHLWLQEGKDGTVDLMGSEGDDYPFFLLSMEVDPLRLLQIGGGFTQLGFPKTKKFPDHAKIKKV